MPQRTKLSLTLLLVMLPLPALGLSPGSRRGSTVWLHVAGLYGEVAGR